MLKISLSGLQFHAFHGLYKEERETGNQFEVNVDVSFAEPAAVVRSLKDTINYARLYQLVKDRMHIPEPLLETVAMDIAHQAKLKFPVITEINVSISKLNPPLFNFQGETRVTYHRQFP